MKKNLIFTIGCVTLVALFLVMACEVHSLLDQNLALIPLFFTRILPVLHGTLIIGIGLGLPLIIVAALLGWGQLFLLITGHISPHLGKEGLMNALRTMFNQF